MKQVRPAGETVPPSTTALVVGEGVNVLVRLALLLSFLRSPLVPLPLFCQRGNGMMVLGHLAVKSQNPL